MAEFMILIRSNEAEESRLTPAETRALVEAQSAYEHTLRAASAFVDGERLRPSAEGKRVTARDGHATETSGPFEDALGGYYLVRADSLDAAVALAAQCPVAPGTTLDVRPVMAKSHIAPEKSSQPGRVFAFAVLGSAPTEQGWIDVMDRIDEKTRSGFPDQDFLGGARLHAPGRGRSVTTTGGHRAIFDGPFLESKEVIGGFVFLRMSTLEDAVSWARQTAFVEHGGLEIRELWRS